MTIEHTARLIQFVERSVMGCTRPDYTDKGRTVEWGKDLSPETMKALREDAEIFTLMKDGKPHSWLLMDYYGTIRQKTYPSGEGQPPDAHEGEELGRPGVDQAPV